MAKQLWGVDSAATANESTYQCVISNYGKPKYWGRYLVTVQNAAEGLTATEVTFLHQRGIKVLPIYSAFTTATGYSRGQINARNAIFHAKRLHIPKDVVIFANVERFFSVDAEWIKGWVDTVYPSGYRPGFYHDPTEGNFNNAYCVASSQSDKVRRQAILWSAEPAPGVTTEAEAPKFNPIHPNCEANVWGWQYGRDSQTCPIDTNLITNKLYRHLW